MKQLKKALITALFLSCLSAHALAGGAPSSQFGFTVWPYRNPSSPCSGTTQAPDTDNPSPAPTSVVTVRPTAVVTTKPTAQPILPTSAPAATPAPTQSGSLGDYTTVSVTTQEYSAWNLLNSDRVANGLEPLVLDEELCRIARIKSCDMKTNHYFAHESPTYGNAAAMLTYFGYSFKGVGENIAHHATVEKAQAAFMSSSGHRANILGSQWTRVGIGVCYDDNGYVYVTQIFTR